MATPQVAGTQPRDGATPYAYMQSGMGVEGVPLSYAPPGAFTASPSFSQSYPYLPPQSNPTTPTTYVPISYAAPEAIGQAGNVSTYIPPGVSGYQNVWDTTYIPEWDRRYTPGLTYQAPTFIPTLPPTYLQPAGSYIPGYDWVPQPFPSVPPPSVPYYTTTSLPPEPPLARQPSTATRIAPYTPPVTYSVKEIRPKKKRRFLCC